MKYEVREDPLIYTCGGVILFLGLVLAIVGGSYSAVKVYQLEGRVESVERVLKDIFRERFEKKIRPQTENLKKGEKDGDA